MTESLPHTSSASEARIRRMEGHAGIDRGFLADAPIRALSVDGVAGLGFDVRLTSYRGLPLSCIAGVEITLDGVALDVAGARLGLDGVFHRLTDMPGSSAVCWFILDVATLFVPHAGLLAPGLHRVTGTLCTIEPYITAGRFAFYNSATKQLPAGGSAP